MPTSKPSPTPIRRWTLRLLILIPILLTLLAWWRSATFHERLAYARGHACVGAGIESGMLFIELFSSTNPFHIGPKHFHEALLGASLWPPTINHIYQGLGYATQHFSDGWMLRLYLPFWLLLLFFLTLALYTFYLTRPRGSASPFPITPDTARLETQQRHGILT